MEKKMLFPQIGGLLHGGDYNPDQWLDRPDILAEDICLMKKAGINSATVGIFAWAALEPTEGHFTFEWLEEIVENLYQNGIYTILSTPSGARPAWLDAAYPEAMRVSKKGVRDHHGLRHNHCMTSPKYREKVGIINRKLAERLGNHPGVLMYHLSNEYGGECYCPLCAQKFREYLAETFDHDIEKLNKAWWTGFWSHKFNSFDQIEPPYENGESSIMGLNLEWKRFTTLNMTDFMCHEIETLRAVTPDKPVTANLMRLFPGLDYRKMAPHLDVISWDNYPVFHTDKESFDTTLRKTSFEHAVMRSLKRNQPFMLMESAPGKTNWQPVNKLRRPGVHRLAGLQAIACGSDTVQYFQFRKSRGSVEQFHGAVVDHVGTEDTRVYREVAALGETMKKLAPVAGTTVHAKAALLFDWDNRWAIWDAGGMANATKNYEETCRGIHGEFTKMGVEMDVVGSDENLDDYKVVVAPMLYLLQPKTAENLKAFVARGGILLGTYMMGYVDKDQLCYLGGFPGDGLKEVFGIISEDLDVLYPSDRNTVVFDDKQVALAPNGAWEVREYAEVLKVQDAQVLGTYGSDFYAGNAALTVKEYGKGKAYYMAARVSAPQMRPLFERLCEDAGVKGMRLPENVECHVREGEEGTYAFYLNGSDTETRVDEVYGINAETGEKIEGTLHLGAYGALVVKVR